MLKFKAVTVVAGVLSAMFAAWGLVDELNGIRCADQVVLAAVLAFVAVWTSWED